MLLDVMLLHCCLKEPSQDKNLRKQVNNNLAITSESLVSFEFFLGPEIDDEDDEEVDVKPSHGIDDGFFDDRHVPDGRGEKIPLPDIPRSNGHTPRRGSIPPAFPYSPPEYGGPGVVNAKNFFHDFEPLQKCFLDRNSHRSKNHSGLQRLSAKEVVENNHFRFSY